MGGRRARPVPTGGRKLPERVQCQAWAEQSKGRCKNKAVPGSRYCRGHTDRAITLRQDQEVFNWREDERVAKMLDALELGLTLYAAAAYARLRYSMVLEWLQRGLEGDPVYEPLLEEVLHRSAVGVVRAVGEVQRHPEKWAMRWLEYRYPSMRGGAEQAIERDDDE